jgi:uncharacterized membrane protein
MMSLRKPLLVLVCVLVLFASVRGAAAELVALHLRQAIITVTQGDSSSTTLTITNRGDLRAYVRLHTDYDENHLRVLLNGSESFYCSLAAGESVQIPIAVETRPATPAKNYAVRIAYDYTIGEKTREDSIVLFVNVKTNYMSYVYLAVVVGFLALVLLGWRLRRRGGAR